MSFEYALYRLREALDIRNSGTEGGSDHVLGLRFLAWVFGRSGGCLSALNHICYDFLGVTTFHKSFGHMFIFCLLILSLTDQRVSAVQESSDDSLFVMERVVGGKVQVLVCVRLLSVHSCFKCAIVFFVKK